MNSNRKVGYVGRRKELVGELGTSEICTYVRYIFRYIFRYMGYIKPVLKRD